MVVDQAQPSRMVEQRTRGRPLEQIKPRRVVERVDADEVAG
jgi:hypothetical protein